MGLFFCTFPRFLRRGSSGHFLGCVFRSRLSCPDSALTLAWSRELVASSACSSPSPPSCVSRRCRAHLAVLEASRPLGLCLLCGALPEVVQVGVTAPGLRLAALRGGERGDSLFGRRSDVAWISEAWQFKSGLPKMFYVPGSIVFPGP